MTFQRIPISERLPNERHFTHTLDSVVFYDVNGVTFLFGKSRVLNTTTQEWIDQGFESWLEEKKQIA